MIDLSRYVSYFRGVRLRTPEGRPVPGSDNFGSQLSSFAQQVKTQIDNMATQGNFNPTGEVSAPPAIQALTAMTNDNGVVTFSIQDQSEGLSRGAGYTIEHADNASFVNPQIRHIGPSRSHSEFIGNQTRFARAFSNYPASGPSAHVYHGSAVAPVPINGGGSIPAVVYPPSQGSGTSAPGQGGYGQGPVQARNSRSGFNWTLQQPPSQQVISPAGLPATGTPAGSAAITDGTGGKGGGSGGGSTPLPPASATVLGSNSSGGFIAAALAHLKIWIGSAGSLPVEQTVSGDATLADTGVLTLATVNASPGTFGDATHVAQVTVNGKGLATAVSSVAITFPASSPPSGPAGGGLAGAYPNPTVALISGAVITPVLIAALPVAPSPGEVASVSNASAPAIGSPVAGTGTAFAAVMWNGSQWTVFSV